MRNSPLIPKILILGASNVGKSQLFNRLVSSRHSIVLNQSGITRDLIMRKIVWSEKKEVILIDSGGYSDNLETPFQREINSSLSSQLLESQVILFVCSINEGVRPIEYRISKLIHRHFRGSVILIVNKIDRKNNGYNMGSRWDSLGFGEPIFISAEHDINIVGLVCEVTRILSKTYKNWEENRGNIHEYRVGIIGKVNVGKSSLVNALISSDRIIVSPLEGTTRDLLEYSISYRDSRYLLIDSPGLKKKSLGRGRSGKLDFLISLQPAKMISFSDILIFVISLDSKLDHIDEKIAKKIYLSNLPTIIAVNKLDILEDRDISKIQAVYRREIREKFYFLSWAPIVFISAKYSRQLNDLFKAIEVVKSEKSRLFAQRELESFMNKMNLSLMNSPKTAILQDILQVKSSIPTFVVRCSNPSSLSTSQLRLIENQFRENFQCVYSPLKFYYKKN